MYYTYEADYKCRREDGRFTEALPAWMEFIRRYKPALSTPEELTAESLKEWQGKVKATMKTILALPDRADIPLPKKLSTVQREGYRVEKWELYPFETAAVPFLMAIPDTATAQNPVPLVLCFPGTNQSKEFCTGEPLVPGKDEARLVENPKPNLMGLQMAQNGMVSITLDPISAAETCMKTPEGSHAYMPQCELVYGLLEFGSFFVALSVFQALCLMDFSKTLPYIDQTRIGLAAHSLGTETALPLALISDEIKCLIFNDFLCDQKVRYAAVTETDDRFTGRGSDWCHIIPGKFRYFTYPDMCAALAPMPLALNEGGAREELDRVRRAYTAAGASEKLRITHYPMFAEEDSRPHEHEEMPLSGLSPETYYEYTNTYPPDHSFRTEPSLKLLREVFNL